MKGVTSKALIVVGILLVVASILWWAIAVNLMVKFPTKVESTPAYEGEVSIYQNPVTGEFLQEPLKAPLTIEREVKSQDDLYSSDKAVVKETIEQIVKIPGASPVVDESSYVIDRKSMENVSDASNSWAYRQDNKVDRSGTYYINFPFDLSKDKSYKVWENKAGTYYEISVDKDAEEEDLEGLKVYNFKGELPLAPANQAYLEHMEYPETVTFDDLKKSLQAKGMDVDGLMALLQSALPPEELQLLQAGLSQPIKLDYFYYSSGKAALEPKTGSIIRLRDVVEGVKVAPDLSALVGLLKKHESDERIAAALKTLQGMEPQPVYEARYAQTPESIKEAAVDAKENIDKINWVKVYVPWILLIVGAALLVVGLLMGGSPAPEEESGEEPGATE
jgi:hypothetical protein